MTDHRYAAIKAAAKALTEIGLYNNEEGLDGPFGGTFIEGPFNIVIPTILHAAEEHIRAMVAQEVRDETCTCGDGSTGCNYFNAGIGHAAKIVEGQTNE